MYEYGLWLHRFFRLSFRHVPRAVSATLPTNCYDHGHASFLQGLPKAMDKPTTFVIATQFKSGGALRSRHPGPSEIDR